MNDFDLQLAERLRQPSEPGPTGGVWWITTEWERYAAITMLRSQVRSIERRADKLSVAPLDWTPPQARLF